MLIKTDSHWDTSSVCTTFSREMATFYFLGDSQEKLCLATEETGLRVPQDECARLRVPLGWVCMEQAL